MPRKLGMFSKKHGYISQVSGYSAQECEMHLLVKYDQNRNEITRRNKFA